MLNKEKYMDKNMMKFACARGSIKQGPENENDPMKINRDIIKELERL
jgi:hypothetical protein